MKRTIKMLLSVAALLGLATSCSDIPAPYDLLSQLTGGTNKPLGYKSTSLSSGWSTLCTTEDNPWSQGSSYTQATGYQDWDGTGSKSNHEVEGYLISPAFNTTCESGKVKIAFKQTIRYESNVSNWQANHKIYGSADYSGDTDTFTDATWIELPYVPEASTTNDWTLYDAEVQLPEELVNQESVYIAYYFAAPSSSSTTWELQNFSIEEGEANITGDGGNGGTTETIEPTGEGTLESPYNVAKANQVCARLADGATTGTVYVKGIVTKIKEVSAQYGNATFYIADVAGGSETFYVYRALGLDNKNVTDENFIKVGDEVIVCGTLTNYKGTYETVQKNAYVYAINGQGNTGGNDTPSGSADGNGTIDSPFNVAGIIAYTSALSADSESAPVYFKGKVCSVKEISTTYGNGTFYISDDGTTNGEQFYVFRCLDLGNQKFTSADAVKVGDEVVIYGPVVNYKGNTPETVQNKAYIYSINGNNVGQGGGNDTPVGSNEGITVEGTTVTLQNTAIVTEGYATKTVTIDLDAQGWDNQQEAVTVTSRDGMITLSFDAGSNANSPKYYAATHGVRMYANNSLTLASNEKICKATLECDQYNGTSYVGNSPMSLACEPTSMTLTNTWTGNGGGTQLRVKTITIEYIPTSTSNVKGQRRIK